MASPLAEIEGHAAALIVEKTKFIGDAGAAAGEEHSRPDERENSA